jgi:butyryl-CoA dehydrogenase/short/branched chain acyl-CoA dehydrogenase
MSQSQLAIQESVARPLTTLSEDEQMFRASVREFAEGEIRKRVEEMDEQAHLDEAVTRQCFELGLMGIETPEEFGGAGGSFFQAILAVEELSRVDASVGVLVDVQNTLVNNALIRWGSADQKKKYLVQLAAEKIGAYALSEAASGSDAFAMQTRAVESGVLSVNSHSSVHVEAPFGGFKSSGLGRDLGMTAMEGYTELKNIYIAES